MESGRIVAALLEPSRLVSIWGMRAFVMVVTTSSYSLLKEDDVMLNFSVISY